MAKEEVVKTIIPLDTIMTMAQNVLKTADDRDTTGKLTLVMFIHLLDNLMDGADDGK